MSSSFTPEDCIYLNEAQLDALASYTRHQIFFALKQNGAASISEIAEMISQTPHSLYHHIKVLEDVRLVTPIEERRSGARTEKIYASTTRSAQTNPDRMKNRKYREHLDKLVRSTLNSASRHFTRILLDKDVEIHEEYLNSIITQAIVELSDNKVEQLEEEISKLIAESVRDKKPSKNEKTYLLTLALVPKVR